MKKAYKVNVPQGIKCDVNDGLVDDTVVISIEYQGTMHDTQNATDVNDAFSEMQQNLTRLAKFKTNISVRDLVFMYYFKLDAITDLLEMRRTARAAKTIQTLKKNSSQELAKAIQGYNPIMAKWTYENVTADYANIINKWNEVKHKIDTLLPLPRFEEFYRRAYFADSVFKDYEKFDRSPLVVFKRKFTSDFSLDGDKLVMAQSQALDSDAEMPLESLQLWDDAISNFLSNDGNYIAGLMRKLETAGVYKSDSGFWQDWKDQDTLPIEDAKDVQEILMNTWLTQEAPSTWTDEMMTSKFDPSTGIVEIEQSVNVPDRGIILAGKYIKQPANGGQLCEALQMNDIRDGKKLITTSGMYITNYKYWMYGTKKELYHHTTITGQTNIDNIQYVSQKYLTLAPNMRIKIKAALADTAVEYFVNQQGQWRFETDNATMDSFIHNFNRSMLHAQINAKLDSKDFSKSGSKEEK